MVVVCYNQLLRVLLDNGKCYNYLDLDILRPDNSSGFFLDMHLKFSPGISNIFDVFPNAASPMATSANGARMSTNDDVIGALR
ncbi:hypothetical protein GCK72_009743 [Caenorhabditis remanei]|uniref:Uncharacterized protein n=1 Tax=Caenorhabditis remanei TaxID=31234 RepID=A0A6A5H2R1_CAERE|nr:hypothetical protein GCK72_009743 [Caenorhabditis remanei]KAF1761487.1 hypothetical protein GCK72_009743 [Caenorhabditis remanei]